MPWWIIKLLHRYGAPFIIGRGGDPYMIRYRVLRLLGRRAYVHCFLRSDADSDMHDHPFPFLSVILCGGYWEHTPRGRKWYPPGRILLRPAHWKHRIELPPGEHCWTLIFGGRRCREWGFWTVGGWVHWKQYLGIETYETANY